MGIVSGVRSGQRIPSAPQGVKVSLGKHTDEALAAFAARAVEM
jgi:hypothetical protein